MENNKELYSAAVLPVIGTLLLPDINLQLSNLDRMSAVRLQQTRFIAVPVKMKIRTAPSGRLMICINMGWNA